MLDKLFGRKPVPPAGAGPMGADAPEELAQVVVGGAAINAAIYRRVPRYRTHGRDGS